MTFQEFLRSIGFSNGLSFWGLIAFLMSIGIEIVPKIKWKPWSCLLAWLGSKLNANMNAKVDALEKKVDSVQTDLEQHIANSKEKALQDDRRDILDFCNACMNDRCCTQEQFDFMMAKCDSYEKYIEEKNIHNGVITVAISELKRLYAEWLRENKFLKVKGEEL